MNFRRPWFRLVPRHPFCSVSQIRTMSGLTFTATSTFTSHFAPRLGAVSFTRHDGSRVPDLPTPGLITKTSRGIVPHLSRDHVELTTLIRWTQVHFETFLERTPPVPTLQKGSHPLHTFLGYQPDKHLISLSVRDPHDGQELPPNGKDFVSCRCVRGVRKMTPSAWRSYVLACKPDVVTALADIPYTTSPHSQKRVMKSLERSTAWLADLLRAVGPHETDTPDVQLNILVHMAGGSDDRARKAFSDALVETLHGKDLELISPLKTLDEGISGYVFDLVPLRLQLEAGKSSSQDNETTDEEVNRLLKISLAPLPPSKPRIAHSARSPLDILHLVQEIGIDLFDAQWVHHAAEVGIALDFTFPVRDHVSVEGDTSCSSPRKRQDGKFDFGHNLFATSYAHNHSRLSSAFLDAAAASQTTASSIPTCSCAACSPSPLPSWITHSVVDQKPSPPVTRQPPFTRAYIHHLLHTHEMSSHTLLAMHNLTVVEAFFAGIREILSMPNGAEILRDEIARFSATYDDTFKVFDEAKLDWAAVEKARGKGRLQREKEASGVAIPDV